MKVIVRYFTILREITERREEEVDTKEGSTIEDMLNLLNEKHGKEFEKYILSGRKHKGLRLLFLINGQNIEQLDGLKTKLQSGSVLTIVPPVAGG
jgi:molybdopterin synthase sulfur carrier subunit